jgi:hypothetical protein
MGLTDLASIDIKESSGPSFEKFDVEKNDRALIHIPSGEVAHHFVHVFHREEPTMVETPDGRKVPRWSRESFAGMYICTGDMNKVAGSPSYGDPVNCPACRAMNGEHRLIERPKRTFALNVIRYMTNKREISLRNNNVEVQLWRHADLRKIEPIKLAAQQKPLDQIDFIIEADNSDWKKYSIQPSIQEPVFTRNSELAANVESAKNNLYSSDVLTEACGKNLPADQLEVEVNRLMQEFQLEQRSGSSQVAAAQTPQATPAVSLNGVSVDDKATEAELEQIDLSGLGDFLNS